MGQNNAKPPANINFSDTGEGNPIVFLHGFMESMEIWGDFSDNLSLDFRIITIDLPGHGGSDCIAEEHNMELMAEEVYNILEILGVNKTTIVGHSMGGYVACAFAAKYPQLLNGLVLFHSHAFADSGETKLNRDRIIDIVKKDKAGFISGFIPDLFAPDNRPKYKKEIENLIRIANQSEKEGIISALKGMKNRPDLNQVLAGLKIPILYILGKYDSRAPIDQILPLVGKSQNAVSIVLETAGHMGYIEEKEQTMEIIRDFAGAL